MKRAGSSAPTSPTAAARAIVGGALALALSGVCVADPWAMYASGPTRVSTASGGAPGLGPVLWTASVDPSGQTVEFPTQAGVVSAFDRVYAIGRIGPASAGAWVLLACDAATGEPRFAAPIPAPIFDSWSTPAIDLTNGTVIVASGFSLRAIDATSGSTRWTATLPRPIVNASPLVTIDRGPADRVLITDYDGFGSGAGLVCINADPFDAALNPHQPGDILWRFPIGGSSGNSPAVLGDTAFVASTGDGSSDNGRILAIALTTAAPAAPLWTFTSPQPQGFFGGLSIAPGPAGPSLFAASYGFVGGQFNSTLVKLDATSGTLRWSASTGRTSSTPIPLPSGHVLVSTGLLGFGAVPSLQLLRDDGSSAARLWDTAVDSWIDANTNGIMDPGEYLAVGGWTTLPLAFPAQAAPGASGPAWRAIVGSPPASGAGPNDTLLELDLSLHPADPAFVRRAIPGAGATPALAIGTGGVARVFTTGPAGLRAIAVGCPANCDGTTTQPLLTPADFVCFLARYRAGDPKANCDGSTAQPMLTPADFVCFLARYRQGCP